MWCEHCRDHYPYCHYDGDGHLVGYEHGPTGALMQARDDCSDLVLRIDYLRDEWMRGPQEALAALPQLFEARAERRPTFWNEDLQVFIR